MAKVELARGGAKWFVGAWWLMQALVAV